MYYIMYVVLCMYHYVMGVCVKKDAEPPPIELTTHADRWGSGDGRGETLQKNR